MKIGVLTGGGDCPGLNAAIRAVVRRAAQYDYETIGIRNGWAGLMGEGDFMPLAPKTVAGIMQVGGTILGAGRTNPFRRDVEVDEAIQRLKAAANAILAACHRPSGGVPGRPGGAEQAGRCCPT